jgi:coenzyme F420 hydrogenase subunit beta
MMSKLRTAEAAAESHLCLSCGMCAATCPTTAIELIETPDGRLTPLINKNICNNCGYCLSLCPGVSIHGIEAFIAQQGSFDGPCLEALVGHAVDRGLRSRGQSGGVASAIAWKLLEVGQVDGVVIATLDWNGNRPRGRAVIARNKEDLLASQGSKYCPMPLFEGLNSAMGPSEKLAVVGLPCHIHAIQNLKTLQPEIAEQIKITIGLFCDRTLTYAAIDYLLRRANLHDSEISSFTFRDKSRTGYPGDVSIIARNGRIKVLPSTERMRIKDQFTPLRCRFCFDKLNMLSDITIGDPHGIGEADTFNGDSVLLVRTPVGKDLITLCLENNILETQVIHYKNVHIGQAMDEKIKDWHAYVTAWQRLGGQLPTFADKLSALFPSPPTDNAQYASMLIHTLQQELCSRRDDLLQSAAMRLGEYEPYFGSISERHCIVEIMGGGFVNKGAMLMMMAIMKKIREYRPDAKVAAVPIPQMKRFLDYDMLPVMPGLIEYPDINFLFDASGFAYSDQWGANYSRTAALKFERLGSYGAKMILLPQAFGPFQNPEIRALFRRIVAAVDLIFVRDRTSLAHVQSVVGNDEKISMAPDFTILLEAKNPHEPSLYADKVCIVPNARMLDKTTQNDGAIYVNFIKNAVLASRALGRRVFFLIHEGYGDFEIAQSVNRLLDKQCEIVIENDPLVLKGILGASAVVVSSRYHSLIGSLSQAIPSICVGWSHKYQELFSDYHLPEGILGIDVTRDQLQAVLEGFLNGSTRQGIIERLASSSKTQKETVTKMWNRVFDYVGMPAAHILQR